MTIAITGATGHIGNNLCRELVKKGHKVKALTRNNADSIKNLEIEKIYGEIKNSQALNKLTENADVVFHLAAAISITGNKNNLLYEVNVKGTENIVKASMKNKVKRFIHFSSVHALSQYPLDKEMNENNKLALNSKHEYDKSKAEAEKIVLDAYKKGLNTIILNPTSVIGINDFKPSLQGQAIIKIAKGKLPALIPGGYDWVNVKDVVKASVSAIEKGRKGERYLLSGHWRSLEKLADEICKHTGKKKPIKIPLFMAKAGLPFIYLAGKITGKTPLYTGESLNILKYSNKNINCEKAKKELGYTISNFSDTVKETINWFYKQKMI